MVANTSWTADELAYLMDHGIAGYLERYPGYRSYDAVRVKHGVLRKGAASAAPFHRPVSRVDAALNSGYEGMYDEVTAAAVRNTSRSTMTYEDKKVGEFNWRDANKHIDGMQQMKARASFSQDTANIHIATDRPICAVALSDTHIGDWATNHHLLESITDEILRTPDLYVMLLGDLAQMAIKLRSVSEVTSNMLPPDLQVAYIDSWLQEIAPRVLFATWDNHAVDREESQSGISAFARLQSRRFVYHSGIGHPNVTVGNETYRFAVSHRFLGRSIENPCHAPMRYLRREGHDREIAVQGDYHVPGIIKFMHGPEQKVAMVTGSFQTNSGYAKRWFSLHTAPVMPAVILHPDRHDMTPLWSIAEWKAIQAGSRPLAS